MASAPLFASSRFPAPRFKASDAGGLAPLHLALIPGDGIGPEVLREVVPLLSWAQERGRPLHWEGFPFGADHFLATGSSLGETEFLHLRDHFDGVLFGAVGDPRLPDGRHADELLLRLRRGLELSVNYRPMGQVPRALRALKTDLEPGHCLEVFRENTEGPYVQVGYRTRGRVVEEAWHSPEAITRLLVSAFTWADATGKRLCLAHKANVLKQGHGLWLEVFRQCQGRFPGVRCETRHADALLCALVQEPGQFDILVGDNLLGDLISDLIAGLRGGMGLAPSASWAPHRPFRCQALFEPVHGSAPGLVATGNANPMGAFASLSLLFAWAGWDHEAQALARALDAALGEATLTPDLHGMGTCSNLGAWIRNRTQSLSSSA